LLFISKITREKLMPYVSEASRSIAAQPAMRSNAIAMHEQQATTAKIKPPPEGVSRHIFKGLHGHDPKHNNLLAALPAASFDRILPHLEFCSMSFDSVVCEAEEQFRHVYFPTSSIVSLLYETETGASSEIAVTGNEGVVGVTLFMGGGTSFSRVVVRSAGYGFRLSAHIFKEEFCRGGALQQLLLRYTQALITQMSQIAVCNRHHTIGQQLCRVLLSSMDRLPSNELAMTQGLIGNMLGVRRESIAEAAGKLQEEGLIHYQRGHITILDRPGLESRVCECYACIKKAYDRVLCDKDISEANDASPGEVRLSRRMDD
jgi:CRP-like cAMP-binding protein